MHTQTLCAIGQLDFRQIGTRDYAQLFLYVDQLGLDPDARAEAFRRMVFNIAAANCDDHTKNFSFLLPEGGRWQLSPAYDVTHAHVPENRWIRQHLMAVNGRSSEITRADVDQVADRFRVPNGSEIVERVLTTVATWPTFADSAGVPEMITSSIAADIESMSSPLH